jgi:hypothetical protein
MSSDKSSNTEITKNNRGFVGFVLKKDNKTWKPVDSIGRATYWGSIYLITSPIWVPCQIIGHTIYAITDGIPRVACGLPYFYPKPIYDYNGREISYDEALAYGRG